VCPHRGKQSLDGRSRGAHEEGVIHRDIKPQTMVVDPGGFPQVMDSGIAPPGGAKQQKQGTHPVV